MHLTHRPVEHNDLPRCLEIAHENVSLAGIDEQLILKLWIDLLAQGSMIMSVVEDQELAPHNRTVATGASVFVTDQFMTEAKGSRPPNLCVQVIQEQLQGAGPALNSAAVRKANSGDGLNVFVLLHGWDVRNLSDDDGRAVRDELIRAFLHEHKGYHLKEIMLERQGEAALRRVLTGGFLLRRDFENYYRDQDTLPPPPEQRPYLAGLNREEARSVEGSTISSLFLYTPPRFRFRPGEQQILRRALLGETDEEMAESLSISESAVKKRWASIFERSASAMPELLPAGLQQAGAERKRGAEKRRRLLAYLRHHPEDLRPISTEDRRPKNEGGTGTRTGPA